MKKIYRLFISVILFWVMFSTDMIPIFATESSSNGVADIDEDTYPVAEETYDSAVTSKLIVTGGVEGVDYSRSDDGVLTVKTSTPLVIDGQGVETTVEQIILGDEASVNEINVTLKDVRISRTTVAPVKIPDNYDMDVNITLEGENILKGGNECAGLEKNDDADSTGMLTIEGDGNLMVTGGYNGAGIGGGKNRAGSNITINGGTVTTTGGYNGAGIGGGIYGAGSNITINGGTVTAIGGYYGAGIGGGHDRAGSNITINGGTVTASGGDDGAGIGGGMYGAGSNITINGGTITASGGDGGAGIGDGWYGAGSNIAIKNASVKAVAGSDSNNIGGGKDSYAVTPLDQNGGSFVYPVCIPHYGNKSIKYRLITASDWIELTFPGFHKDDDLFYLYLPEGIYDFISGEHEFESVPVGPESGIAAKKVSTRRIVMDDIFGNELTIVSENCYKTGNTLYDCSSATDEYFIEQRTTGSLIKNIVVKDASKITVKDLNLSPLDKAAFLMESKSDMILYSAAGSENIFVSSEYRAGIEKAKETGMLILDGEGTITATGGYRGAGIGGGDGGAGSNITINGGTVTASGGNYGAGIGGGNYGAGSNITINGGTVTASGGYEAGIGGGDGEETSDIFVSGGNIKAGEIGCTPKKSSSDPLELSLVKIGGYNAGDAVPFASIPRAEYYNLDGVVAHDDGCFYFYLPEGVDLSSYQKYKVEFVTGEGSEVPAQSVISGGRLTRPDDPVREGYLFTDWYKSQYDKSASSKWDFEKDTVTQDTTLYAGWATEIWNVNFDTGCNAETESQRIETGYQVSKPADPVWEGHIFTGWYKAADCKEKWDFNSDTVNKDMTLYAGWMIKYTAIFVTGCDAIVYSQSVEAGEKIVEPKAPVRDGYIFKGWFKTAGSLKEADKWDFEKDTLTRDTALYAGWIPDPAGGDTPSVTPGADDTVTPTPASGETPGDDEDITPTPSPVVIPTSAPVPVIVPDGGDTEFESPMNPVPVISENTAELYLVKGQKFTLPAGNWFCDVDSGKIIKINSKGVLTAKKVGSAVITNNGSSIKVTVTQPVMQQKNYKVEAGQDIYVGLNYDSAKYAAAWYSSDPDIATVSANGLVHGVGKGTATITAYINGSRYSSKVKVTEGVAAAVRTLHMNVGTSKTLKIKGVKNAVWKAEDSNIATVTAKGKVTALAAGNTLITVSANGTEYKIYLYAEDITLKNKELILRKANKYEVYLKAGESFKLEYNRIYSCPEYKSSKVEVAYIETDGTLKAMKPGKTKITTKINKKTVTITVNVS